ncbi:hypothetical protein BDZ97DRAFT_780920 [Flammula alnicola]|nr:hypothetical protein BDZ97DRAFT_780920 [Flammula alnicola]
MIRLDCIPATVPLVISLVLASPAPLSCILRQLPLLKNSVSLLSLCMEPTSAKDTSRQRTAWTRCRNISNSLKYPALRHRRWPSVTSTMMHLSLWIGLMSGPSISLMNYLSSSPSLTAFNLSLNLRLWRSRASSTRLKCLMPPHPLPGSSTTTTSHHFNGTDPWLRLPDFLASLGLDLFSIVPRIVGIHRNIHHSSAFCICILEQDNQFILHLFLGHTQSQFSCLISPYHHPLYLLAFLCPSPPLLPSLSISLSPPSPLFPCLSISLSSLPLSMPISLSLASSLISLSHLTSPISSSSLPPLLSLFFFLRMLVLYFGTDRQHVILAHQVL